MYRIRTGSTRLWLMTVVMFVVVSSIVLMYKRRPVVHDMSRPDVVPIRGELDPKLVVVNDCVTGTAVYKIRPKLKIIPFDVDSSKNSPKKEDDSHRMASFRDVYKNHHWGVQQPGYKGIQGSGQGSSVDFARHMMKVLGGTIDMVKKATGKNKIRFLDIPCGDMVWMQTFLENRNDVIYTGMDIVPELIKSHNTRFANRTDWSFRHQDIVKNPLDGSYDIIHCRHMLQHLTTADALKVLKHFSDSGSRFLLTTTWANTRSNAELSSFEHARFRNLNLEIPPFSLVPPLCIGRDWPKHQFEKQLYAGMWSLPLVQLPASEFGNHAVSYVQSKTNSEFHVFASSYE
ncbi:uncharacterized protein LOC141912759 [Tubulanus polymorphus]|uniref:uncharacterized protein LOC141912759 n=1 Tax=Tubulanus polymorphus TaxID=672921 RepID=UPI003DA27C3C